MFSSATNALRFIHEGLRIAFRHSFAIALLPAFAFPAWSAITFVQSNYSTPQSSQTSVSVTFTAAQTAGDLNMIVVGWNDSSAHVASVTDKSGNVYTLAVGPTVQSGVASQSIYYAKNIVAATAKTNIVTVTFSRSAAYPDIRILEYSGADPNNPVDVAGAGTGSSSTSSASATTTNVADLVFAANLVQTMTTGAGNGFTKRLITSPDGDIAEDMMAASAGTYTATAPLSSGQWIMQMVALRAVSNGLTTTYSISGKVSGSAATVALSGTSSATTTVAAGGTYTFSGLKNGSYTVTPTQSGYTFSPASASVTVNGANVSGVNFTGSVITAGTYSISGKVTGSAATVALSGTSSASTTVAAGGTYTFSSLKNGSYTVTPTQPGYTFSPISAPVTVNGANVSGVNFTGSVITAGSYSISGKVSGSAATLTLSGTSSGTTTVAAGGTYTFSGLANGSYVVSPSETGYSFSPSTALETVNNANITGVNFTATALPPTVTLSWTASTSPNISGYNVYRGTVSGGPYSLISSSLVTGTSYVDTTVRDGQTYYYVTTAVDSSNNQSSYSNQAVAAVP